MQLRSIDLRAISAAVWSKKNSVLSKCPKIANLAAGDDDQDDENDQRPEIIFIEQGGQGSLLSYSTSHQTSPGLVRRSLTS